MGILRNYNLVSGRNSVSANVFEGLFSPQDFSNIVYSTPKDYVNLYWNSFKASGTYDNAVNGKVFEFIIETLLIRSNILPFYTQAKMAFVPAIDFDIMLYSEDGIPYLLSLKTSFRERWKQADLEAEALKNVHRRAKCYLLTITPSDAQDVKNRIVSGEAIAIDDAIDCKSDDIDSLISDLQAINFIESLPVISAVKSGRLIQ